MMMYLDGSYSQKQQFDAFKRSLQSLSVYSIGEENFMFTSPYYYGVNQHPEFEKLANEFLDRTFRKWNLDLVSEAQ